VNCDIFLYENSTLVDVLYLFTEKRSLDRESFIPILKSKDQRYLVGSFKVQNALEYLLAEGKIIEQKLKSSGSVTENKYQNFYKNLGLNNKLVSSGCLLGTNFQGEYISE
jgi:hypothetical protein